MTIEEKLGPLGLAEYLPLFSQEKITLELLGHLEEEDLIRLGMPMGPRKALLAALGKKSATARDATNRAQIDAGVTVLEARENTSGQTVIENAPGTRAGRGAGGVTDLEIAGITSIKRLAVSSGEADLFEGMWQGRKVALKWFRYGITPKSDLMATIQKLDRRCVVEVLETGVFEERAYEVMEFIEHGNLGQWVRMGVAESKVREVLKELGEAVQELHRHNIIHRDIKPTNILVRTLTPLDLVLTDFGISSLTELSLHQTSASRTVAYSAPESQSGVVSKASDWWSVGVVVLELLTGRGAFEGLDERTINFTLATKGIEIPETLPGEWRALLSGLLCQDESRRWGWGELSDWMEGKELPPPLVARGGVKAAATAGGGPQAAIPYRFKGGAYATAPELARVLAENWEAGVKHFGRGLILEWLKNDLKDAEKVVQASDLAENGKLTPEMKFAAALLVLDSKMPFSWKGDVVDEAFAHSNGELLWSMVEAGVPGVLGGMGVQNGALEMVAGRREDFLKRIEGKPSYYDLKLAKQIIGAPESRILEQALERASGIHGPMKETLPDWMQELPGFKEWFLCSSLSLVDGLVVLSCKKKMAEKVMWPFLKSNAFRWCSKQVEAQEAKWQERLGWMYEEGWGVTKDEVAAAGWYGAAAAQGNPRAQAQLGEFFKEGRGVEQNDAEAVGWFGAAAVQCNSNAQYWLGWMIANGRGAEVDEAQAAGWYFQAAQQGDGRAQYELGQMYYHGRGVEKCYVTALEWFEKSAEQGNGFAQTLLGFDLEALGSYADSLLDVDQRLSLLYQGDQLDIAKSQFKIGEILVYPKENPPEAFKYFWKSANKGYAEAQFELGYIYRFDNDEKFGVQEDENKSFQWFLKSAENEYERAYCYLGMCYYYGRGVKEDFALAFKWYYKAAKGESSTSQNSLAEMYEKGEGINRDLSRAIEWYEKAAEQGNEAAQKSLIRLKSGTPVVSNTILRNPITHTQTHDEIQNKVVNIIVEQLGVSETQVISSARFVEDLGADEVDCIELVMAFEEEFGLEIPDESAESLVRVRDVINYIRSNT